MLYEFLISKRADIIDRTKAKVAARGFPGVTDQERTQGIPLFFDQLVDVLKGASLPNAELDATARKHGDDLLRRGFTIGQVVHDYGNVCQAVTELAFELNANITVDEFHTLNGCLDDATAQAVSEFTRLTDENRADQNVEQMGDLKRQLRQQLDQAMLSFTILTSGSVSMSGSTAKLHDRSLKAMNDILVRWPE